MCGEGVKAIRSKVAEIDAQIRQATDRAKKAGLAAQRRTITHYASFDFALAEAYVLAGLDK